MDDNDSFRLISPDTADKVVGWGCALIAFLCWVFYPYLSIA